jgi:SAM-dependent methyltransferase
LDLRNGFKFSLNRGNLDNEYVSLVRTMRIGETMTERSDSTKPLPLDSRYERYLRNVQYAQPDNLNARLRLHAKYSTSPIRWFEWLHQQFSWSGVREALDVGCGTGLFWSTLPFPLEEVRLVLADISRSMIELATVAADQRVARVHAVEASVQSLPFEDSSFDVVVANHMLYHASDPECAVAEIRRVLRPGGLLVASTIGPGHLAELVEIERAIFSAPRERVLGDVFGPLSGVAPLERHFDAVEWRTFDDRLRCTDVEDVLAYITSTPPGAHATREQLQALREEIQRRMDRGRGVLEVIKEGGVFLARCSA